MKKPPFCTNRSMIPCKFGGQKQGSKGHSPVHNVLSVVAGIIPAAVSIPGSRAVHAGVKIQTIIQVSGRPSPFPSLIGRQFHARTLEIK